MPTARPRMRLGSAFSCIRSCRRWRFSIGSVCSPKTAAPHSPVSGRHRPISSRRSRRRATASSLQPGTALMHRAGHSPAVSRTQRRESVADGGSDWVEKFNHFIAENSPIILSDSEELPPWAAGIKDYGVFQRGNIWNMQDALLRPNADVTLIALWNQKAGEGPGGTADMVKLAKLHGAKVREQNSDELFAIASS